MMMQTPSVTSSIGAEGMSAADTAWPGVIADDDEAFASAAVKLYKDKHMWAFAQSQASTQLGNQFDSVNHINIYKDRINKVLDNLEQNRLENFTGSMLKHHSMRSTKYLSKWIEEKNKQH